MKKRDWTTKDSTKDLPKRIREYFTRHAYFLYNELLSNRHEVELQEAPQKNFPSHKIRVLVSSNPSWYSALYETWSVSKTRAKVNSRRLKFYETDFSRKRALKALKRISEGMDGRNGTHHFSYDKALRDVIYEELTEGRYNSGERRWWVIPEMKVRAYFGLEALV